MTSVEAGDRGTARRVAFIDHCAALSGGEIALARMVGALSGVESVVILGEHGPIEERLRDAGAQVEVLELQRDTGGLRRSEVTPRGIRLGVLRETVSYVWRLRARLRLLQPDLVHTNSLKAALYGGLAGRLAGVPVVWHVRDRIADDYLPHAAVVLIRLASKLLPRAIIADSKLTALTIDSPRRPVEVVYSPTGRVADRTVPIRDRPLHVAMVGRLAQWKGQDVFLRAFAAAFGGGPEQAVLMGSAMFGEDAYEQSLRHLVRELDIDDQVTFAGFVADVHRALLDVDALVHASVVPEPFGQVVLDGMGAGIPVIATRPGGPAEIISDGVDGLLVPCGDVTAMAHALTELARDPDRRSRLAEAGLVTVRRFLPEAIAPTLEAIYDSVLPRLTPVEI